MKDAWRGRNKEGREDKMMEMRGEEEVGEREGEGDGVDEMDKAEGKEG